MSANGLIGQKRTLIVFVHGLLGFDVLTFPGIAIHYFRKLQYELGKLQLPVLFPRLPAVGRVDQRGQVLAECLGPYKNCNIYIIAHSMGGLDSRYYIQHLDRDNQVRGLATIGTPHRGTVLASWYAEQPSFLARVGRWVCRPGIFDLTPEACRRFNETVPNRSDVHYFSYAGCRPVREMALPERRMARIIQEQQGENDGLVPVSSAIWGDFHETLRADHFELVGWNFGISNSKSGRPFDHIRCYKKIIHQLLGPERG